MSKKKNNGAGVKCDFCGRNIVNRKICVSKTGASCCGDCAADVIECLYLEEDNKRSNHNHGYRVPTPEEIVSRLDQHVIGQDETKRTLAVAVYNHYKRIEDEQNRKIAVGDDDDLADVTIEKSNILMLGPTGSGKTLFAKTIAKMLDVPFAIADATTLTQAGYVGEDVENIVRYLWMNAEGDIERTQKGIIYLDEVDKIASKTQNVSLTRDVSGEGVQQSLLKVVEGTTCRFPPTGGRKHPEQPLVEIDTTNILFICGGAFVGLDEIVNQRLGGINDLTGAAPMGFCDEAAGDESESSKDSLLDMVTTEDLVEYGLIPEFVGRIPIVTATHELDEDDLVRVLKEPKNSLVKQYRRLLRLSGCGLSFSEDALRKIAHAAIENKTGARGLRSVVEKVMKDVMFKAPSMAGKSIEITASMVDDAA